MVFLASTSPALRRPPMSPIDTRSFLAAFRRIRAAEEGAVAIIVAVCFVMLLGFLALGLSVGNLYLEQRRLQTRTDLAAMAGAANLLEAGTRAADVLEQNGVPPHGLRVVEFGRFNPNPDLAISDRWNLTGSFGPDANGVSIEVAQEVPLNFAAILSSDESLELTARATATRHVAASFSVGSRLAALDDGVLNSLLNAAFGTNVSFSIADYQALADSEVTVLPFLEALGTQLDFQAGNYVEILDLEIGLPDLLTALAAVAPSDAGALLAQLASTAPHQSVRLDRIISVSDTDLGLAMVDFLSEIQLSLLPILLATADVINADQTVDLDADLSVPGLLSVVAAVRVSERPVGSSHVVVGEPESTLHTAQTRLRTELDLAPELLGDLGLGVTPLSVRLPLYAEIGAGTARLAAITCSATNPAVTFDTSMSDGNVARLFIGSLDPSDFSASGPIDPSRLGFADFLDVSLNLGLFDIDLLTIQMRSYSAVGQASAGQVLFATDDLNTSPSIRSFGSVGLLGSATASLLSSENTEFRVKPVQDSLLGGLVSTTVNTLLGLLPERVAGGLLAPIDATLDGVLDRLGVGVGEADILLYRRHCDRVRLVDY